MSFMRRTSNSMPLGSLDLLCEAMGTTYKHLSSGRSREEHPIPAFSQGHHARIEMVGLWALGFVLITFSPGFALHIHSLGLATPGHGGQASVLGSTPSR